MIPRPSPLTAESKRRWTADLVAGLSVAMILVPQSMAYAELAGMPAIRGLYAAALPLIAAALFASSPYLQTGPDAVTALMTFGALSTLAVPGGDEYVRLAGVLALLVGIIRFVLWLVKFGPISYLMSQPVLRGFLAACGLLIVASQIPTAVGVHVRDGGALGGLVHAVEHPRLWNAEDLGLTAFTLILLVGGRRFHPLFPGILLAVIAGVVYSSLTDYRGPTLGPISPSGLPAAPLHLPLGNFPRLFMSAIVIALVGFAPVVTLSQAFAEQARRPWDPNREFLSQGAANFVAGLVGAFPMGASFARTSINRLAGARTPWSGGIAGLAVLVVLPFSGVLTPLPRPVLAAVVIGAVMPLLDPAPLLSMWRRTRPQAAVGIATFVMTLALSPHIEYAVLGGIALALAVHVWREMRVAVQARVIDGVLVLKPMGVIWFGSAPMFRQALATELARHRDVKNVLVDLSAVGRIDLTGAMALREVVDTATEVGVDLSFCFVPDHAERIMDRVCGTVPRTPSGLLGLPPQPGTDPAAELRSAPDPAHRD